MNATLSLPALETTVRCSVAAWGSLRAAPGDIATWRRQAIRVGAETLPVSFFKHAEDQTVVAVRAVLAVLDRHAWHERTFTDWGVIAAGSFFGRPCIAQSITRFAVEGVWAVAPHLIPQQSLHAMSGTISQALKIHGPNFGVGVGPNAAPDALLLAAAMLHDRTLPGLWLVLTGHETEWIPLADDRPNPAPVCQAAALALTPVAPGQAGPVLTIGQVRADGASDRRECSSPLLAHWPEFHLGLLAEEMSLHPEMPSGKWRLAETFWAELDTAFLPAEDAR